MVMFHSYVSFPWTRGLTSYWLGIMDYPYIHIYIYISYIYMYMYISMVNSWISYTRWIYIYKYKGYLMNEDSPSRYLSNLAMEHPPFISMMSPFKPRFWEDFPLPQFHHQSVFLTISPWQSPDSWGKKPSGPSNDQLSSPVFNPMDTPIMKVNDL